MLFSSRKLYWIRFWNEERNLFLSVLLIRQWKDIDCPSLSNIFRIHIFISKLLLPRRYTNLYNCSYLFLNARSFFSKSEHRPRFLRGGLSSSSLSLSVLLSSVASLFEPSRIPGVKIVHATTYDAYLMSNIMIS